MGNTGGPAAGALSFSRTAPVEKPAPMRNLARSIVETVRHPLLIFDEPRIDGLQVLQRVRADPRTRHVPVVILTSSREDQDLIESYDLGANSYVRKPVDFAQFAEAVRQLQMYWLVLNEAPPLDGER